MKLVIVADPDEYVRSQIKAKLETTDLKVIALENGLEVWETLEKMSPVIPDCLITESNMPKMNGYLLTRRLCASEYKHKLHIIIYSWQYRGCESAYWSIKQGADDHVNKTDGNFGESPNRADAPDAIKALITEFADDIDELGMRFCSNKNPLNTENSELKSQLKSQVFDRLIDYSLPMVSQVVNDYIYPKNSD